MYLCMCVRVFVGYGSPGDCGKINKSPLHVVLICAMRELLHVCVCVLWGSKGNMVSRGKTLKGEGGSVNKKHRDLGREEREEERNGEKGSGED